MNFAVAFWGLVLATLEYSVMMGEPTTALNRGRAINLEAINALGFSISTLALLYGLCHLFAAQTHRKEMRQAYRLLQVVTFGVAPLVALGLTATSVGDAIGVRALARRTRLHLGVSETTCHPYDGSQGMDFAILGIGIAAIAVILIIGNRRDSLRITNDLIAPIWALAVSLLVIAYVAALSATVDPTFVTPVWLQHCVFGAAVVAVAGFTIVAFLSRPAVET